MINKMLLKDDGANLIGTPLVGFSTSVPAIIPEGTSTVDRADVTKSASSIVAESSTKSQRRLWHYLLLVLSILLIQPFYFLLYSVVFLPHVVLAIFSIPFKSKFSLISWFNKLLDGLFLDAPDSYLAPAIFWRSNGDKAGILEEINVPVLLIDLTLTIASVGISTFLAIIYHSTSYGLIYFGINAPALLFGGFKVVAATVKVMRETYDILKSERDAEYKNRLKSRILDVANVWGDWLTTVLAKVVSLSLVVVNLFNILAYLGATQTTAALLSAVGPVVTVFAQSVLITGALILAFEWIIRLVVNNSFERNRFRQEKDALKQEIKKFAEDIGNIRKLLAHMGVDDRQNDIITLLETLAGNPEVGESKRKRKETDFRTTVLTDKLAKLIKKTHKYSLLENINADTKTLMKKIETDATSLYKKLDSTIGSRNTVVLHSSRCWMEISKRLKTFCYNLLVGFCLIGASVVKFCTYLGIASLSGNDLFISVMSMGGMAFPFALGFLIANLMEAFFDKMAKQQPADVDVSNDPGKDFAKPVDWGLGELFAKLRAVFHGLNANYHHLCSKLVCGLMLIIGLVVFAHNIVNPVMLLSAGFCAAAFVVWTVASSLLFKVKENENSWVYKQSKTALESAPSSDIYFSEPKQQSLLETPTITRQHSSPSLACRAVHKNKASFSRPKSDLKEILVGQHTIFKLPKIMEDTGARSSVSPHYMD